MATDPGIAAQRMLERGRAENLVEEAAGEPVGAMTKRDFLLLPEATAEYLMVGKAEDKLRWAKRPRPRRRDWWESRSWCCAHRAGRGGCWQGTRCPRRKTRAPTAADSPQRAQGRGCAAPGQGRRYSKKNLPGAQGQLRVLEKAPESVVVREEGRGGGANDNSSITKVANSDNYKVATVLGKPGEVRDGVSPENQLKVVRIASASASIAGELWASGALVGKGAWGAWGAWGAGGGGDWGAGWSGSDGHYSRGFGGGGDGWGALDGGAHAQGMGPGQKGGKGKGKGGGLAPPCFHLLRSGQCGHMRDHGFCNFAHTSASGKKLCPGHFLNGGCNADGACALAHSVAE